MTEKNPIDSDSELKQKEPEVTLRDSDLDLDVDTSSDGSTELNKTTESDTESADLPDIGSDYTLLEKIGEGGMGTVYKARNTETDQTVAIKLLKEELSKDAAALKRFQQEAEAARTLEHENLASVYDYRQSEQGTAYLVMEYIEGKSLADYLKKKERLSAKETLSIYTDVCQALEYAHAKGVIHRDVKPTNIILCGDSDSGFRAKIVDFGIAKVMPAANRETHNLTKTGDVFGSPNYMSPEQCLGFMLDQRSDIYSLGCSMYETLSGAPPFSGENPIQVVMKQVNEDVAPLPKDVTADRTAKSLQNVILKCLEKEQENRYQSISEVQKDLALVQEGKKTPRYVRRKKAKAKFTIIQVVALTLGLVIGGFCLYAIGRTTLAVDANSFSAFMLSIFSVAGVLVFGKLSIELWSKTERFSIPKRTGWLGLTLIDLTLTCLCIMISLLYSIYGTASNNSITSHTNLVFLFAAILAGTNLFGCLLFRSSKNISLIALFSQSTMFAFVLTLSMAFVFPKEANRFSDILVEPYLIDTHPGISEAYYKLVLMKNMAIKIDRRTILVQKLLAVYIKSNQPEKALRLLEENKKYWKTQNEKIDFNYKIKQLKSLIALNERIGTSPRDYSDFQKRSIVFANLDQSQKSIEDLTKAIKLKPDIPKLYSMRAKYRLESPKSRSTSSKDQKTVLIAVEDLSKAIELASAADKADFLIARAFVYKYLEREQQFTPGRSFRYFLQSKKDFFRALKFADNKPESIRKLYKALIYGELGDETNLIALGLDSRRLNSYSKELIKSVHNTTALSEHTWMIYLNLREPNILMESPNFEGARKHPSLGKTLRLEGIQGIR